MKLVPSNEIENIICDLVSAEEVNDIINIIKPQMEEILKKSQNAVGLAAPQVGIKKKYFIIKNFATNKYDIYFNAYYIKDSDSRVQILEGCLSYPGRIHIPVKRFKSIKAFFDELENGKLVKKTKKVKQMDGIVFQHETDHCGNGPESVSQTIYTK